MAVPGSGSQKSSFEPAATRELEVRLNWELPPWFPSLRNNVTSLFKREQPTPPLGFRPGIFWRDVFVDQQLNRKSMFRSYAGHVIFAGLIYVLSMPFYWNRIVKIETFHNDRITYINPEEDILVSEPTPPEIVQKRIAPVISRSSRAANASRGEPRRRVLEAMAIPKWSDNSTHTIVAPDAPKILASAPVPDIVLSSSVPQAPPVAAVASNTPKLVAPVFDTTPVAPPPDVTKASAQLRSPVLPQPAAIAPPVVTNGVRDLAKLNIAPVPAAVNPEPKLTVSASHTLAGLSTPEPIAPTPDLKTAASTQLNKATLGPAQPIAPPPDIKTVANASGVAGKVPGAAEPLAPPPDLSAAGSAVSASGMLISINSTPVAGAPRLPDGNRRGTFAGHPDATENSTGAPAKLAGGAGPGGDSPTATKDELGIVAAAVPHGILNGAPITTTQGLANSLNSTSGNTLLAMARPSRISLPPPRVATVVDEPDALDQSVFRGRKYYTMALNTPNLTSAGGSWIFRFAERGISSKAGEVTAPIVVREVDPAYPADLIKDNVQGMVILYAVIRADGTVAQVKVLEGFDDRLDENARKALSAWHFVPGTRDGSPVDLEAVVRIPFRSKRPF
ncbi:MAG TPA: TonB family protein [Terriglobales bacterium]|jgi:TonB family protein|nr:TonB family protein [Terriglobales bacterium]